MRIETGIIWRTTGAEGDELLLDSGGLKKGHPNFLKPQRF